MNIYELERKASPGRLMAEGRYIVSDRVGTIAESYTTGNDQCLNDAKLLVHCRNNFMKALDGLKEMQETIRCIDNACPSDHEDESMNTACALIKSYCNCAKKDMGELIAELEEVK